MTDGRIALRGLLEKGSDASFLREMIGFAAQRLMELEVCEATGAAHGERGPERLVQRNGCRERDWQRPEPAPSNCASPNGAVVPACPPSWGPAAPPRRRAWQ